jgi:glycosyltransferase involved in cell wall biosynthesis
VDAHYAFVGGYRLQERLAHFDFAHPIIEKRQDPMSFSRSVERITHLVRRHGFDIVHAHLSYDHLLARWARRDIDFRLARTFHSRRVLRRDPFNRWLLRSTEFLFVINDAFLHHPALAGRRTTYTPPPLDHRYFTPEGPDMRATYGISPDVKLVTVIGKVSKGRGFEDALRTFAGLRALDPNTHLMIIGHGEHRPFLENLSRTLGVEQYVTWAGYHEDDLVEHYRAADLLIFTARGSDEGHRAVLEAMACAVPAISFPLEGIATLVGREMVSADTTPGSLADLAARVLRRDSPEFRRQIYERSLEFGYDRAAQRLLSGYVTPGAF